VMADFLYEFYFPVSILRMLAWPNQLSIFTSMKQYLLHLQIKVLVYSLFRHSVCH
jgi:hypothetical protein